LEDAVEHEATLRFVTNLDRAGIEAQLRQVERKAAERRVTAVAGLLAGAEGKSRQELEQLVAECLQALKQTPGQQALADQLEMVQINLPNLG
jgi:hypothetical protein